MDSPVWLKTMEIHSMLKISMSNMNERCTYCKLVTRQSFVGPDETEDHLVGPVSNGNQRNYVREARADILPSQTTRRHHNVNAEQDHADHVKEVLRDLEV